MKIKYFTSFYALFSIFIYFKISVRIFSISIWSKYWIYFFAYFIYILFYFFSFVSFKRFFFVRYREKHSIFILSFSEWIKWKQIQIEKYRKIFYYYYYWYFAYFPAFFLLLLLFFFRFVWNIIHKPTKTRSNY